MKRVLVTGATGFVGGVLCEALKDAGYAVRAAVRAADRPPSAGSSERVVVGELGAQTDWGRALVDIDCVVHLAARVHASRSLIADVEPYMEMNVRGTASLAAAAAAAGVRRFLYLSSIKVNGEETTSRVYTPFDKPEPGDAYGMSKWLGENHLLDVAARGAMEAVIVRAPLVYGAGVRANFLQLLRWVDREWPFPFGAVRNARSLVSVWNLCDLLVLLLKHPAASRHVWMVSDGENPSTPELIRRLGQAMKRRVRLPHVAPSLIRVCAGLVGQKPAVARLCGSLVVDDTDTHRELGWVPALSLDKGLERTCRWYLAEYQRGV